MAIPKNKLPADLMLACNIAYLSELREGTALDPLTTESYNMFQGHNSVSLDKKYIYEPGGPLKPNQHHCCVRPPSISPMGLW